MKIIKKAKVVNGSYLEVEYDNKQMSTDGDGDTTFTDTLTFSGGQKVHADLLNAFDALTIHLAVLCEQVEFKVAFDEPSLLSRFSVTGFSIGGSGEHSGVTLIGRKDLKSKKVLNLCAPFTKYDPETSDYEYCSELYSIVSMACGEVVAYLEGKHEPSKQMKLELA